MRLRVNYLSCYSGSYKVTSKAWFRDHTGARMLPAGTTFSDSGNNINTSNGFRNGYDGTGQWHSRAMNCATPYWGIVEFPAGTPFPTDLHVFATSTSVLQRAMKDLSVEYWDGAQWITVLERYNEPEWAAGELRIFPLQAPVTYSVRGVVYDRDGLPCQRTVMLINRTDRSVYGTAESDPVTGEYSFTMSPVNGGFEYARVVLSEDDADPRLNDIIDRVQPVEDP